MAQLIWTPESLLDVQRLYRFLLPNNKEAAQRAIRAIRNGASTLAHIGRPIEELSLEFREWLIDFGDNSYVIRYRYEPNRVFILAIRHQKEAGF